MQEEEKKARKRQTQSCDRCKYKKRKCDGDTPCGNCIRAESKCTMLIEQKKRGPKRGRDDDENAELSGDVSGDAIDRHVQGRQNDFQPQLQAQPLIQSPFRSGILDFDNDFIQNFTLDYNQLQYQDLQKKLTTDNVQIDPQVLEYYTLLNPKTSIQSELDQFLQSTIMNPGLQSELPFADSFFMHLITMFFTYYHSSIITLDEKAFLQQLIPTNRHHPMLLNTIYAIGCRYSRSPCLYQNPFYSPQKAYEYFIQKALSATPPPEQFLSIDQDSIEICQSCLLLVSLEYSKSVNWMLFGMIVRLVLSFEFYARQVSNNFLSKINEVKKFHVSCSPTARKRVWWGALMVDLYHSLSTGSSLAINEQEYTDTLAENKLRKSTSDDMIPNQPHKIAGNASDADRWVPLFSGFPKDTIFGASNASYHNSIKQPNGIFQVEHLFCDEEEYFQLVQLSFMTRKTLRLLNHPFLNPTGNGMFGNSSLFSLISSNSDDVQRLHETLIMWFENLPVDLRLWNSLEVLASSNPAEMSNHCLLPPGSRLSSTKVLTNLLFFATISLLHQPLSGGKFRVASTLSGTQTYSSSQILEMSFKGQEFLVQRVYGNFYPPKPTFITSPDMVSASIIPCLLMITGMAAKERSNVNTQGLLAVLENIGQVWSIALSYIETFKKLDISRNNGVDERTEIIQGSDNNVVGSAFADTFTGTIGSSSITQSLADNLMSASDSIFSNEIVEPQFQYPTPGNMFSNTPIQPVTQEKSWHELRSEFEDEFLL